MSKPLPPPPKKNPNRVTEQPLLPPTARSRAALGLGAAAAAGRFALQCCEDCGMVAYPPRDACAGCLSDNLPWREIDRSGTVLAETRIHASPDPYFRTRLPWRMGSVQLSAGPVVLAHLHQEVARGDRVQMDLRLDRAGHGVMVALPQQRSAHMEDDPMLRAMGTHPRHRRVLISDGRAPEAPALVEALLGAGAAHVFVGEAEPWRGWPERAQFEGQARVSLVPLDVTDPQGLAEQAAALGGKVDLLINTARYQRAGGVLDLPAAEARRSFDVTALGLMALARAFGPAMAARAADGVQSAAALVQMIDIGALAPHAGFGVDAAAHAAARAVLLSLRAELGRAGVRVACVYAGPFEDDWHQHVPPPKLTGKALARAVVAGLIEGREEIVAGDVAREILTRWREDAAVLEREMRGEGG